MDLPDVNMLLDYWEELPPVHILVGGYLGMGQKKGKGGGGMSSEQLAAMLGATMPRREPAPGDAPSLVIPSIPQQPGGNHG